MLNGKKITQLAITAFLAAIVVTCMFATQVQAAHKVNVTFAASGLTNFDGVIFTVDGDTYDFSHMPTPKWGIGSTHTIVAASPITDSNGVSYQFAGWTNGNGLTGASGTFTTPSSDVTVTANYQVILNPTALTVNCTPDTVNRPASNNTIITGCLTTNGAGLAGKTVVLSYMNASAWYQIASPTTLSNGTYSYSWTVPATLQNGYYIIKAEFAQDSNYLGSSALTGSDGNGHDLFVLPEYSWGTITAIIACFAAVLMVKKRSAQKTSKKHSPLQALKKST